MRMQLLSTNFNLSRAKVDKNKIVVGPLPGPTMKCVVRDWKHHFWQAHAPKPIHFLKAHVSSYSKTAKEHKYNDKDKDNYKYEDKDEDKDKHKEIESCTSDSPTSPNPYIFWKLLSRAIEKRQRDTNTKTMTITNTKTKTKTRTPRQYLEHLECAIF